VKQNKKVCFDLAGQQEILNWSHTVAHTVKPLCWWNANNKISKISVANKHLLLLLSKESYKKSIMVSTKIWSSTTVFNIDNNWAMVLKFQLCYQN